MRGLQPVELPVLSELPVIGVMFTRLDVVVYMAIAATVIVGLILTRTRVGLVLRAVGENHDSAHALGFSVIKVRFAAIAFGGAFAGMGGAYLSCVMTPLWIEGMTAGRGWIAVALVGVDSGWVQNSTLGTEDALAVVSQIAVRVDVAIEGNGPHA